MKYEKQNVLPFTVRNPAGVALSTEFTMRGHRVTVDVSANGKVSYGPWLGTPGWIETNRLITAVRNEIARMLRESQHYH